MDRRPKHHLVRIEESRVPVGPVAITIGDIDLPHGIGVVRAVKGCRYRAADELRSSTGVRLRQLGEAVLRVGPLEHLASRGDAHAIDDVVTLVILLGTVLLCRRLE